MMKGVRKVLLLMMALLILVAMLFMFLPMTMSL